MSKNTEGGYYLVEVLVSIFVLSIGVLCAAGMQLTAIQTSQQSGFQTLALQLAVDMANQIRVNTSSTKLNDGENPYLSLEYKSGDQIEVPSAQCLSVKDNCSPGELANFTVYEWKNKIKENLPEGRVLVCRDKDPWDSNASRYTWQCNSAGNGNSPLIIKLGWYEKKMNQFMQNDHDKNYPPILALAVGI
ncbi:MAG: type IV pilus modification protein PilV [Burkholderiaceae bacterium]